MIQCKRVYDDASHDDGYRILVDRLWPRGVRKADLACDEWCKMLSPSTELRKAFHGEMIDFDSFSEAYRQELAQHEDEGRRIAALAAKQRVTLLYGAKNTGQNHALVLADWLRHLKIS
ncbi:DUF488 domain-containing protein [Lelliottia sp. WAP21]|jgi:uncharacterized protein YeaO (DUF488 family)|uniref:DUF488 domain-containing protein n=1 Tax=Lelliottia sp. WAP21 TaxID=2877426 RepID=UPI001E558128|nr:DUF488 domain-containing protein [Lelliottia sp. WAP21]